jgi:hypothetical protein
MEDEIFQIIKLRKTEIKDDIIEEALSTFLNLSAFVKFL